MSAHHTFELTFFSTFFELFPTFARGMTAFICFLYQSLFLLVKSLFLLVTSLLLLVKSPFLLVESLFLLVRSPFFTKVYDSRSASPGRLVPSPGPLERAQRSFSICLTWRRFFCAPWSPVDYGNSKKKHPKNGNIFEHANFFSTSG